MSKYDPADRHRDEVAEEVRQVLVRLQLAGETALQLIQPDALVKQVLTEWPDLTDNSGGKVGDLAYQVICQKIYNACNSNQEGLRDAAWQWLGGYLYRGIWPKLNGDRTLTEDLTNNALELIFKRMESCRQPEFFLSWAAQIATREMLQHFRKQSRSVASQAQTNEGTSGSRPVNEKAEKAEEHPALAAVRQKLQFEPLDENQIAEQPGTSSKETNPEAIFLSRERLRAIVARIEQFKPTKRASQYKAILYGTYFLGQEDSELAKQLNLSLQEIQKQRYQALKLLRSDEGWIETIR